MQGGPCTPIVSTEAGTSMACVVPNFTSPVSGLKNISYTIRVGAVPGPDLTNMDLTLDVKPNPVFPEDGSAIVDNQFSGGLITLKVSLLCSVPGTVCSVFDVSPIS